MERIKLGFIGAGNMAGAIIDGVVKAHVLPAEQVGVYDINQDKTRRFGEGGHPVYRDIPALAAGCEYVVLAVKPQNFTDVLPLVKEGMGEDTVLVSIAAGITAERIQGAVGFACKLVLVMPNTPLLLGHGASALARVEPTGEEEFAFVRRLFSLGGVAEEVPPDKMKEIIAVNGSSPAFLYRFVQVVCEYAGAHGIDQWTAMRLCAQTLIGSAHMLTKSGKTPQELVEMVCSPGGTTIAALEAMGENGFEKALREGCEACLRRAEELSQA